MSNKKTEEDKKESWTSYLAFTTVIFAVCATLATFKGGGYSTQSIMNQTKASDSWAYFQSKSIKGDLYKMESEKLKLEMIDKNKETSKIYQDKIDEYKEKIEKYAKEKDEAKNVAEKLEKDRDMAQIHGKSFGLAVIFLQITILMSTISGLLKKKTVWYISLASGSIGIFYFLNGFFLFI